MLKLFFCTRLPRPNSHLKPPGISPISAFQFLKKVASHRSGKNHCGNFRSSAPQPPRSVNGQPNTQGDSHSPCLSTPDRAIKVEIAMVIVRKVWVSVIVNFTLPGLRFHETPNTSVFLPHPVTPLHAPLHAPFLAWPRPFLAQSSPGLARSSARSSAGPRRALAHPRFNQSSRQNGQKRNLLVHKILVRKNWFSGTKTRGFRRGFLQDGRLSWLRRSECQMYCWGQYPWLFFVSLAVTLDSTETPFAKTPCLGS